MSLRTRFLVDTQDIPRDPDSAGVQVIAAGLWRCATSSLQLAFEQKLQPALAPSMHGAYIMPSVKAMQLCAAACREQDTAKRRDILHQVFDGYNASSDFPGMAFVDDLLDMYPSAKVILNKRSSATAWTRSVHDSLQFFSTKTYMLIGFWFPQSYWHYRIYTDYAVLAKRRFDVDDIFTTDLYKRHNQWVKDVAAARGLEVLEWEPSMGWEALCKFTGRKVPLEPFPQLNEGEAIRKLKRYLILRGLLAWLVFVLVSCILYNVFLIGIARF